jgi:glycosyltransferase involved in cell wall biosynthesis
MPAKTMLAERSTGRSNNGCVLEEQHRWPSPYNAVGEPSRVAVVTVNYNTRDLIALLLWSVYRVLEPSALTVVVVDNGSIDGSPQFLADLSTAGLCSVLANDRNCGHGSGLNQAMSFLAHRAEVIGAGPDWVWVLDSDCVVARPDALSAPLGKAVASGASLVGEYQCDQWHGVERFGAHCLLFEPATVWRDPVSVFSDGGDPVFELLASASRNGLVSAPFPFLSDGYAVHLGRGSLAWVAANEDRANPLYDWALGHHIPHFANVAGAAERYVELQAQFLTDVEGSSSAALVQACAKPRSP